MLISVRLDRDTKASLARLAGRTGRSRSALVRDAIRRFAQEESGRGALELPTFAERLAPYVGSVNSGGLQLSERSGERVREILLQRAKRRNTIAPVAGRATRPPRHRPRPPAAQSPRPSSRT